VAFVEETALDSLGQQLEGICRLVCRAGDDVHFIRGSPVVFVLDVQLEMLNLACTRSIECELIFAFVVALVTVQHATALENRHGSSDDGLIVRSVRELTCDDRCGGRRRAQQQGGEECDAAVSGE
jgi:hypothetical protein